MESKTISELRKISRSVSEQQKDLVKSLNRKVRDMGYGKYVYFSYFYDPFGGVINANIKNLKYRQIPEDLMDELNIIPSSRWYKNAHADNFYTLDIVLDEVKDITSKYKMSSDDTEKQSISKSTLAKIARPVYLEMSSIIKDIQKDIKNSEIGKQGKAVYKRDQYGGIIFMSVRKEVYQNKALSISDKYGLIQDGEWSKNTYGGEGWITISLILPEYVELRDEYQVVNDSDEVIKVLSEVGYPVSCDHDLGYLKVYFQGELIATIIEKPHTYVIFQTTETPSSIKDYPEAWNRLQNYLQSLAQSFVKDSISPRFTGFIDERSIFSTKNVRIEMSYEDDKSEIYIHKYSPESFSIRFFVDGDFVEYQYISDDTPSSIKDMVENVRSFDNFVRFYNYLVEFYQS